MTKTPDDRPHLIATNGREPAETRITLKDGSVLAKFLKHPKGVLQNPLSEAEMWAKFDDCVACLQGSYRAHAVRRMLERFEHIPDIRDLTELLAK